MQATFLDVDVPCLFDDLKLGERFIHRGRRYVRVSRGSNEGYNARDVGTQELWVFGTGIAVKKVPNQVKIAS
jgi:hypothetical protein